MRSSRPVHYSNPAHIFSPLIRYLPRRLELELVLALELAWLWELVSELVSELGWVELALELELNCRQLLPEGHSYPPLDQFHRWPSSCTDLLRSVRNCCLRGQ